MSFETRIIEIRDRFEDDGSCYYRVVTQSSAERVILHDLCQIKGLKYAEFKADDFNKTVDWINQL